MNEIEWAAKEFRILDHVPAGAFALRSDFVVLFWNSRLEDWIQMQREQVVGLDIGEHYPHLKEPKYASRLQAVFEGGPPTVFSSQFHKQILPVRRRDGSLHIQHTTVTAVQSSDHDSYYALFVIEDVTEVTHRIQDYGKVARQLQEVNEELEGFASTVSHDLRAPLRSVQGFANALLEDCSDQLDEEGQQYARFLIESAQDMDDMIQDLLAYSRLGRTDLDLRPVLLTKVISSAMSQLEVEVKEQGATIDVAEPMPEVITHHSTLVQVVANLISNAIKFVATDAEPRVSLYAEERGDNIRLWVADNGIGISPEFQERIFLVFERLHGVESYEGTGIGLAIVRKGIERLGGAVGFESELGDGSKFWIELPKVEGTPHNA